MTAAPPVPDPVEAARGLWDRVVSLAEQVDADGWHRPTPCTGWDVHDLVGHLSGLQVGFDAGVVLDAPPGWEPPEGASPLDAWTERAVAARRGWSREEVVEELGRARDGHLARLAAVEDWQAPTPGPTGTTTEAGLLAVRTFDVWVHLQDLREALDLPFEADDRSPAAALAHGWVVRALPYLFGKRAAAPEGATLRVALGPPVDLDTVLEVHEGRARFVPHADAGDDAVTGSPAALTMLCAGRHDAAHWRAAGLLEATGARGEALLERARLF